MSIETHACFVGINELEVFMLLFVSAFKHRQDAHKGKKLYFTGRSHLKMNRFFESFVEKCNILQKVNSLLHCMNFSYFFLFKCMILLFGF